jgi:ribonucleoside-diphosphate reductase alpha chain
VETEIAAQEGATRTFTEEEKIACSLEDPESCEACQ